MWRQSGRAPVWEFLGWTFLITGVSYGISMFIDRTGVLGAAGELVITLVDTLLSALSPAYGVYLVLRRRGLVRGPGQFARLIVRTQRRGRAAAVVAVCCLALLGAAALCGTRTDAPWYWLALALPLMVLSGGLEEVGWRGFLQPALEKRFPFIAATLLTTLVWELWHLPLWLLSTANQSSFDFLPYLLQLTVNAFVLAAIYRMTGSVAACVVYHAWGNAIGAVYHWELFATYPIRGPLIAYYVLMVALSIAVCTLPTRPGRVRGAAGGGTP